MSDILEKNKLMNLLPGLITMRLSGKEQIIPVFNYFYTRMQTDEYVWELVSDYKNLQKLYDDEKTPFVFVSNNIGPCDEKGWFETTKTGIIIGTRYFTKNQNIYSYAISIELIYVLAEYRNSGFGKILSNTIKDVITEDFENIQAEFQSNSIQLNIFLDGQCMTKSGTKIMNNLDKHIRDKLDIFSKEYTLLYENDTEEDIATQLEKLKLRLV